MTRDITEGELDNLRKLVNIYLQSEGYMVTSEYNRIQRYVSHLKKVRRTKVGTI